MELRFVARDGENLVLESDDGQRYHLAIDSALKDGIRANPRVTEANFSPREIQNLIRSGLSVEQVAHQLEQPASAIEPFAAPILDELRFVLEAALGTQVAAGAVMKRFDELVADTTPESTFSAAKIDGDWIITAVGSETLTWRFDPKARSLEPTNPEASNFSRAHSSRDIISSPAAPAKPKMETTEPTDAFFEESDNASVHSLVDELRNRRKQEGVKPATAKGRASLPSWDEIVLGATNSETDLD
ncbi:septation protein SepH [Aquiluna sp.]|nr:septation protein SepH [Aquiluna sp.]MDA8901961.1 septation protein SepH [Aquiluna sp.]